MAINEGFHFDRVLKQMQQVKNDLPILLANQAENYFSSSFKKQGFDGQQWEEVKRREEGTDEWKYPGGYGLSRRTNPILIGGGRIKGTAGGTLRRAVGNSIRSATFENITLIVDLSYAEIHNKGGMAGRGGSAAIPKRQFMGQTAELTQMQITKVNEYIDKIWKP